MRRAFLYFLIYMAGLIIQWGWMKYFAFYGLAPDIVLIMLVFLALMRGPFVGELMGFFWGLAWDVMSIQMFGARALAMVCIGFTVGFLSHKWDEKKIFSQIIVTGLASVAYYILLFATHQVFAPIGEKFAFNYIVFYQVIYNMLLAPVVFTAGLALLGRLNLVRES
jgi:rod shape-determining protein MreD